MNKLLNNITSNKNFKRWLGIILAIALVATMFPYMSAAYGNNDKPAQQDEPALVEAGDNTIISEEDSDVDGSEEPVEGEGPQSGDDGIAVVTEEQTESTNGPSKAAARAVSNSITWNGNNATINAGDTVNLNSALELPGTGIYTLTVNGTLNGVINVGKDQTLNLKGTGTINGKDKKSSVITVKGRNSVLILNEDQKGNKDAKGLTIKNGFGTAIPTGFSTDSNTGLPVFANTKAGGGIQVQRANETTGNAGDKAPSYYKNNPKLIMYGGTITGNNAEVGGGIYIDRWCNFEMYGGTVAKNTATKHEGGGIYTAAPDAKITAGNILNNTSQTTTDWGGGGIFVESRGKATLSTVKVWNNTAYGLGGGISGCPHARIGVAGEGIGNITEGAAVYGNAAYKIGHNGTGGNPQNKYLYALEFKNGNNTAYEGSYASSAIKGKDIAGDFYAYHNDQDNKKFTKDVAQDYYCTRASIVFGQGLTGSIDSSRVAWTGRYAGPEGSGDITIKEGQWYSEGKYTVGLTAQAPKETTITRALRIEGNTSYTHGGGIGCNGQLVIGQMPSEQKVELPWSIEFNKVLNKVNNTGTISPVPEFEFGLYSEKSDSADKIIATAKNDSKGNIVFTVNNSAYAGTPEGKTYTFYAKEIGRTSGNTTGEFDYDSAWHEVKVTVAKKTSTAEVNGVNVTTTTSYVKNVDYGTNGSTFTNTVKPKEETVQVANPWNLEFTKQLVNNNDMDLFEVDADALANKVNPKFTFNLYKPTSDDGLTDGKLDEGKLEQIATAQNETAGDNKGKVTFKFVDKTLNGNDREDRIDVNQYRKDTEGSVDYTFYVKETVSADDRNPLITYDDTWHKVVVTIDSAKTERTDNPDSLTPTHVTTYTSSLKSVKYYTADENGTWVENTDGKNFVNIYHPEGALNLQGSKSFFGAETDGFTFTMQRVNAPGGDQFAGALTPLEKMNYRGSAKDFTNDNAPIIFDEITYDSVGDYWYMITEDPSEGVITDPRVYVVKVSVAMADNGLSLIPSVAELYYAEGIETDQDGNQVPLDYADLHQLAINSSDAANGAITVPELSFSNFDEQMATMSAFGYAVNAASNAPIDQQCFVDPKIIKNLEGRSLTEGEFNFKLIEINAGENGVVDWSQTQGVVISETSNDRYGMVDFDKANNVSGDWENPSCLLYTAPGTYYYRVVEANDLTDPSVDYSKQIITFTTVIEFNEDGQLECTDMYYGHVENGENVRYTESENPQWHPTMTNYARGMDLQVRKTSALDRENGLEGATYGLYAVNNGAQADIFLGEGTSNEDGWITFKNVSLNEGTLYYFKERLAPAGHTVSEFRSSYFYIAKDPSAPNGYTMMYTDSKADMGSKADASDIVALAEAQDAQDGQDGQGGTQSGTPQGAQSEDGNMIFTFEQDGGVFDEATYTEIAKVDTRTHEWVEGAELSIIEKDSGKVINSWKSGTAVEVLQGKLNVDTTYILREDKAPEGYAKADDVEFKIDQYGAVEILSGTSNGNAELQDATIRLYDTMLDAEVVETVQKENVIETPDNSAGGLSKTGDYLPIAGVALLALGSLIVLLVVARKRKNSKE